MTEHRIGMQKQPRRRQIEGDGDYNVRGAGGACVWSIFPGQRRSHSFRASTPANVAVDVPLALAIVGLGVLIVIAPSSVPALTPPM